MAGHRHSTNSPDVPSNRHAHSDDGTQHKFDSPNSHVGPEVDSDKSLADFIRQDLNLSGTKVMCREAGCGACVVAVTAPDAISGLLRTFSVNACMVSVMSCADWAVTTVEGLGGRAAGYHPLQKALAEYNGSQCGYCSPGWVMAMYSLLESKHYDVTEKEVEDSFGSNVCRCTGYRPILDAFKSFAKEPKLEPKDIEDLQICNKSGIKCQSPCSKSKEDGWCFVKGGEELNHVLETNLKDGRKWFKVNRIADIFDVLNREGYDSYMLVAGNTGKGAYPIFAYPQILIDISGVKELKIQLIDQNLVVGSGTTLTDLLSLFENLSKNNEDFYYLQKLYDHINLVAHIPVRNIGTIAGNLMVKYRKREFSSDLYLLFETVGAIVTIVDRLGASADLTPEQFLNVDMTDKIIVNVKLPPLSQDYLFFSYKLMARSQSAHAEVNCGLLFHMDHASSVVKSARIVMGGLSPKFTHAKNTEKYMVGKKLFDQNVLQDALKVLDKELIVEEIEGEPSVAYRKKAALGVFYKGILHLCPDSLLSPRYRSGGEDFKKVRPLSKGKQVFDTNPNLWPDNEPMPKVEALIQCAGEAPYSDDQPSTKNEVFAAFVTTTVSRGEIEHIDPSAALNIPGVLKFYSAKDIPGINSFQSLRVIYNLAQEEVLCDKIVKYHSQPLGIIVAETQALANRAVHLVKVKYKNTDQKAVYTIKDAKTEPGRVTFFFEFPALGRGLNVQKVIKGNNDIFGQYHFTMEPQTCVSLPSEDGVDVYVAAQWMDSCQISIAEVLNINENRVNLYVKRVGGGYGAKISRNILPATACCLVTYLMNRPCRFVMSIEAMMSAIGKRLPSTNDFEVGVDDKGEIQYLEYFLYDDNGYVLNEPLLAFALTAIKNCYDRNRWHFRAFNVTTDTASNSWCRSPGSLEGIAMTEYIMERISYEVSIDPVNVRLANLNKTETALEEMIQTILRDSDYEKRKQEVKEFNDKNRWKKRGIRFVPMSWPGVIFSYFHVLMTVYYGDGSVVITHGGTEIGQGIHTKAIQVCAYTLKIPMSKIKVKTSNVMTAPNSVSTGNSISSEQVCLGVIKCCQQLLDRLAPLRARLKQPTWEILVYNAYLQGINLQTNYTVNPNDQPQYRTGGAAVAEVELDLLTGEHSVLRVDIIEDTGLSLNPEIDVGQVEGAFIMGMGYWTTENLRYDQKTGRLLNNRTWNYYVPLAKDIPIDFRIQFRRNSFNTVGILGSKLTGEPASCLAIVVAFALREAITSSREDSGRPKNEWFYIGGPYTNENMLLAANAKLDEFKLQ